MVAFEPGRVKLAASQLQEFRRPTRGPRNHTLKCAFVVRGAAAAALWSRGIRNAAVAGAMPGRAGHRHP
jgi:hypothetical protein